VIRAIVGREEGSMDTELDTDMCDCGHSAREHEDILEHDGSVWPHGRGHCRVCSPPPGGPDSEASRPYCLRFSLVETTHAD